jgi:hypothetical protein
LSTSSPSLVKLADNIEGAIIYGFITSLASKSRYFTEKFK